MKEPITHSDTWGLALIFVVIASWLLYRYLVPKTWQEWASVGVVQTFIIAFYAEIASSQSRGFTASAPRSRSRIRKNAESFHRDA